MKSAIQKDDAMDARALVLAGLDVDSTYDESISVEGYSIQTGSTLLHWAAVYNALECTKVREVISIPRYIPSCRTVRRSCDSLFVCLPSNLRLHCVGCRKRRYRFRALLLTEGPP